MRLTDNPLLLGREVDNAVGGYHVHALVGERDILYLPLEELHVLRPSLSLVLAGQTQHLLSHVQPISLSTRGDPLGREQDVYATTAAQVQHDLAGRKGRQGHRVAAL